MKTLLLLILFQVQPQVYDFHGVYYGQQNTNVVNLGWYIQDSYPNEPSHYIISRNDVVVYTATLMGSRAYMVSIPVERGFKSGTFKITRNVNGVNSQVYSTFVKK